MMSTVMATPHELEARALQANYRKVHDEVFGGSWLRRMLPLPALVRQSDFALEVRKLREMEDRLRILRLACASSGSNGDLTATLQLMTYTESLNSAVGALRHICERLQHRAEGEKYETAEFAADIDRYYSLIEMYDVHETHLA